MRPFSRRKIRKPSRRRSYHSPRKAVRRKPKIDLTTGNLLVSPFKNRLYVFIYRLSLILVFFLLVYGVFLSPLLEVQEVMVSGETSYKEEDIQKSIEPLLEGKILGLFSKRHLLFIPARKIRLTLLEEYKGLKEVSLERQPLSRLVVKLTPKEAHLVVCNKDQCTPLDASGSALNAYPRQELSQLGPNIEIINDESASVLEPGRGVNSKEYVNFILGLKKELKQEIGLEVRDLYTPLPSASEVKIKTEAGWLVYFNTQDYLKNQITALGLMLDKEVKEEDKICLEYVDLRIDSKIYYKLVDDCDELKKAEAKRLKEEEKKQQAEKEKEKSPETE